MAKNTRPFPSKSKPRSVETTLSPDCTTSASPNQLFDWLKSPPSEGIAKSWSTSPWPLRRAIEIEHRPLFRAWIDWGCNPTGFFGATSPNALSRSLVNVLSEPQKTVFMQWMLEDYPGFASSLFSQLRQAGRLNILSYLDWGKILNSPHMEEKTAVVFASHAFLGDADLPVAACLDRSGGRLGSKYDIRSVLSPDTFSFHASISRERDVKIAARLDGLGAGRQLFISPGQLAAMGGFYSALALLKAIQEERVVAPLKRGEAEDFSLLFSGWSEAVEKSALPMAAKDVCDAVELLLPHINWRQTDRKGCNVLHVFHLPGWPMEAKTMLLSNLAEFRPAALGQKDPRGNTPLQSTSSEPWVKEWLLSFERRLGLNKTLKNQVKQTQVVKEASRNTKETAPRRM